MFISHVPVLNFAGTALHITPRMCAKPEPTFQRYTTKAQTLRFSSQTSVLNFAGTALHVTPRMCANPSSSLFWILPEQITPRMCANPSWTYLPQIHHKTSNLKIFISHICFELCRNSSPCYTTHVSQPILYQCPKIHHKRLMTQFCKPIPIQPPKIHPSKFQRSPYRRQKCRALQEDTVEWKPVCDLQAKKLFSVSFSGLNYLCPTYCKNALKRSSLGWNPLASWFIYVDGTVVLHLKSRNITSFLLELRRIAWPLRIHLLQHGRLLPRMTHTNPLDILGSRKTGAVQLTGAVPVPSQFKNKNLKYVKDQKPEAVWLKSGFKKQAPTA